MIISGEYHNGLDTGKNPATFILGSGGNYKVIWADGEQSGALAAARISARLGTIPRHIHYGDEPPEECPVCKYPKGAFKEVWFR